MPRKTRKRLLRERGEDESLARRGREDAYQQLEIELHQAWRDGRDPLAPVTWLIQPATYLDLPSDVAV